MPMSGINTMRDTLHDARTAPAPTPGVGRRMSRGAALWATIGFVSGAVFWHGSGLWDVVSAEVAKPNSVGASGHADLAADPMETGSLPSIHIVDPARCTGLELDRQANRTIMRACPSDGLALRLDAGNDRSDLAALAE
jgi:hypothetical protein